MAIFRQPANLSDNGDGQHCGTIAVYERYDASTKDLNYNIPLRIGIRGGFPPHILVGIFPS